LAKTTAKPKLEVRSFKASDEKECARIGAWAFSGPGTEARWRTYLRRNPHLTPDRILVAVQGRERVGMAANLDLKMAIEGKLVPVDGVAAVGVDPLHRQQGVANALVREAIRRSVRKRRAFSALHPFRESFYRKFGYALFEWAQIVTIPPATLPWKDEPSRVRFARPADTAKMKRCYRDWIDGRTGPLERSSFWWKRRVLGGDVHAIVFDGTRGSIEGYAIGSMVERGFLGLRRYRVVELVALTDRARRGLLSAMRRLSDEVGRLELILPPDDPAIALVRNPPLLTPTMNSPGNLPSLQIAAGCMARITDLEKALLVRNGRGEAGTFRVELHDPHLPENEQPRFFRFSPKGPEILRTARGARQVRGEVGAFTQVLLGAVSASVARRDGQLECDEKTAAVLDRAWHGPAAFLSPPNHF
jgi:predicted acetyltransferase